MARSKNRILFIEPDESLWLIISAVLQPETNNWELVFCATAIDALSQDASFDVIITAHTLPDGNGIGLCDVYKEVAPETIRYLMIDKEEANQFRSLISSAQQILVKPLDLKSFKSILKRSFALRSVVHNPEIQKVLGGADTLPPLPRIFQELSNKLSSQSASMAEIAELIAQDVVISSKVLQLANSALFSLRVPASTISHATSLLGSNTISSLVFSQSVADSFKSDHISDVFIEELNTHSIECAGLASEMLESWGATKAIIEKSVFCGIAHDLGKLILAKYAPEKWTDALLEIRHSGRPDVEVEREIIGIGHPELAAYLLAIWGFATDQIMAIAFHHEPSRANETEFGILCALHVAENCCSSNLQNENFDWDYLEACRVTKEEVETLKIMHAKKKQG